MKNTMSGRKDISFSYMRSHFCIYTYLSCPLNVKLIISQQSSFMSPNFSLTSGQLTKFAKYKMKIDLFALLMNHLHVVE